MKTCKPLMLFTFGTLLALASAPSALAQGPGKHRPAAPPPAFMPPQRTEAVALFPGEAFSVASEPDFEFPTGPGTHYHSDNGFNFDTGPDLLEVGQLCEPDIGCEEIRGMVEFDLANASVADVAALEFWVVNEGGLFQQPGPGEFVIEVLAYEADGLESLQDYDRQAIEFIAEFDSFQYGVEEFVRFDVTELYNQAVEQGWDGLGFRLQAAFDPGGFAMVYGDAALELQVNNIPEPLSVSLDIDPSTVEVGQTTVVSWESSGAEGCEATGGLPGWPGDKALSGSQSFMPDDPGRYTFRISCNQFIVSIARTVFLDVRAPAPEPGPDVDLTAARTSVDLGGAIELSWTSEDAVSCSASSGLEGFNGSRVTSGSEVIDATVAGVAGFSLTCTDADGLQASDTVSVAVNGDNPDLFVQDFRLTRDEQETGGPVGFNLLVGNDGDAASGGTTVRYYLSENATVTPSDTFVGQVSVGAVTVGGETSVNGPNIAAPNAAGRYWLGGCIDAAPGETDLADNCTPALPVTVTSNVACAEAATQCGAVVGGGLSSLDCQGGPRGAGFPASKQVINLGAGQEVTFEAEWLGDLDGFISLQAPGGGPFVASNDDFEGMNRSRVEVVTEQAGDYTLWVTSYDPGADGDFEVTTTCGAGAPDLVPSFVDAPQTALVNDNVELDFEVENQGDVGSGSSFLTLRVSADDEIGLDDRFSLETTIDPLNAGASDRHVFTGRFSEPGNYWMGACVEPTGDAELFTANNCSAARLVEVRNPSDCAAAPLVFGQAASGEVLEQDCDASPRGAGYPSRSHTFTGRAGQVIAGEVLWDGWDGYVYIEGPDGRIIGQADDSDSVFFNSPLGADRRGRKPAFGAQKPLTDEGQSGLSVALPEDGEYKVWVTGFQPRTKGGYELNFGEVLADGPAFVTEGVSLNKAAVSAGEQVVASLAVGDQGGQGGYEVEVFFFLSTNSTLSEQDDLFARRVSQTLAGGATTQVQAFLDVPVSPGTYWLGACARIAGSDDSVEVGGDRCDLTEFEVTSDADRIAFNPGLNDSWFDPATSGQGFFLEVFPDIGSVFLTWFTFETDGTPVSGGANLGDAGHRWFTAQGEYDETGVTMNVTVTSGGVFGSEQPVSRVTEGTMRLEFLGCNAGVLTYDVVSERSGRLQGTIPIQRLANDNILLCESFLTDDAQAANQALLATARPEVTTGSDARVVWRAPDGMRCRPERVDGAPEAWTSSDLSGTGGTVHLPLHESGDHRLKMVCKGPDGSSVSTEATVRAKRDQRTRNTGPEIVVNEGLNDAWIDPRIDGQGFLINVYPELQTVFAAWFTFDTFDASGGNFDIAAPGHRWITAYGPYTGNEAELEMTLTRGGAFDEPNPRPTNENGYGTLKFTFESCDAITADYDIPAAGRSGSLDLQRITADRVASCLTKGDTGPDEGRGIRPDDKAQLENLCDGTREWVFEWEPSPVYNTYQVQIRQSADAEPRVDELVETNRYRLTKSTEVPEAQLEGWTWRVRGIRLLPQAVLPGPWSEKSFSVAPLTQCN